MRGAMAREAGAMSLIQVNGRRAHRGIVAATTTEARR
jgi:hypothetical protein